MAGPVYSSSTYPPRGTCSRGAGCRAPFWLLSLFHIMTDFLQPCDLSWDTLLGRCLELLSQVQGYLDIRSGEMVH